MMVFFSALDLDCHCCSTVVRPHLKHLPGKVGIIIGKMHSKDIWLLEKSRTSRELFGSFQSLRIDSLYLSDEDFDIRNEDKKRSVKVEARSENVETHSMSSSNLSMMNVSDFSSASSSSSSISLPPMSKFFISTILRSSRNSTDRDSLWIKRRHSDTMIGGTDD